MNAQAPVLEAWPATRRSRRALAAFALCATAIYTQPARAAAPCDSHDLALLPDAGTPGDFDGMSHSGTMFALHNTGKTACSLPTRPALALVDRDGQALPLTFVPTSGGTGHAATSSIELPPNGNAQASLRWVSGAVYQPSRCLDAAALRLSLAEGVGLDAPIAAHLCGQGDRPVAVEQGDLRQH